MFEKAFVPLTDGDELMSCEFVIARDDCTSAREGVLCSSRADSPSEARRGQAQRIRWVERSGSGGSVAGGER